MLRSIRVGGREPLVTPIYSNTAIGIQMRSRCQVGGVVTTQIQRNSDPRQQTILNIVRQLHVLHKRVIVRRGLLQHPPVHLPRRKRNRVGIVRVRRLHTLHKQVVKVQLPNMQRRGPSIRIVWLHRIIRLHNHMQVRDAAVIMAREQRVKGRHPLVVGELHTAEKGRVEAALALGRGDARVHARAVAVPNIGEDLGRGCAGVHVDKLQLEVHGHAGLALGDVGANGLARDIIGPNRGLGDQGARVVAPKDGLLWCLDRVARPRRVVALRGIYRQICQVSLLMGHGLW